VIGASYRRGRPSLTLPDAADAASGFVALPVSGPERAEEKAEVGVATAEVPPPGTPSLSFRGPDHHGPDHNGDAQDQDERDRWDNASNDGYLVRRCWLPCTPTTPWARADTAVARNGAAERGLPCAACAAPTDWVAALVDGCARCARRRPRPRDDGLRATDPAQCARDP
jgi:hypothetical protein